MKKKLWMILFFIAYGVFLTFASGGEDEHSVTHLMTNLVFQVGIIIFAARLGGVLIKKIKMPGVLGELAAGIIVGPYLLGKIPLPFLGFPHGLFPHSGGGGMPVTVELYSLAVIASIILLFIAGLETDLDLLLKFFAAGTIVGIGGIVVSFILGDIVGMLLLNTGFMDTRALFLGVLSTATSVGITARILSEHKKMDSPEGVTILAAAVIDDVLGIILLAIIIGIASVSHTGGGEHVNWFSISLIGAKAVGVWLGFTAIGLIFAKHISNFLKSAKNSSIFSVLALGLALIIAGVFEKAGLAMIIGAYVMGLALSKTDISYVLQEKLHGLYNFFVPIFFTVMGMMVNLDELASPKIIIFGLIYATSAVLAKVIGSGLPSLFLNFNATGALRIGVGMIPRGEVALIIAGIGIAKGIIDEKLFGLSIIMTLFSTIVAPPILNSLLKNPKKGTRKDIERADRVTTTFDTPSPEISELITDKIIVSMENEGFFIHLMEMDVMIYQMRKNDIFLSMSVYDDRIQFESSVEDVSFIKNLAYESLLDLNAAIVKLKDMAKPEELKKDLTAEANSARSEFTLNDKIFKECILLDIKSETKEDIITEMVDLLDANGKLDDKKIVLEDVLAREQVMSTGMQDGIALPHSKTLGASKMVAAVGLKKEGVDFEALDGKPSNIFVMLITPKKKSGPHLQFLSTIGAVLNKPEAREKILSCSSEEELLNFLIESTSSSRR